MQVGNIGEVNYGGEPLPPPEVGVGIGVLVRVGVTVGSPLLGVR